jgi:hypothetical protein
MVSPRVSKRAGPRASKTRIAMHRKFLPVTLCAALCIAGGISAPKAHADTVMRCGAQLVERGDNLYTVQSRCGAPTFTTQYFEFRSVLGRTVQVVIDQWVYDFGPDQFVQTLTFEQGILQYVASGHYGTKK